MDRRFPARFAGPAILALAIAPACATGTSPDSLAVHAARGGDFPELIVHLPRFDATGDPMAPACDQVRARRIDELDPVWKRLVDRVHLECERVPAAEAGDETIATTLTAYLRPGAVQLAGAPVAEVRLMDSERWGDRQYIVDRPFAAVRDALAAHVEMRCGMAGDDPTALGSRDCTIARDERGVFIDTGGGGIWIYPDPYDAARTVYAEAWAE